MPPTVLIADLLAVLGLGSFFGLAFEEFYLKDKRLRPGGIRTFPLLALAGALLYRLDPERCVPFCTGLVVLGLWLALYYRQRLADSGGEAARDGGIVVPVCNLLAYLLGAVALAGPLWVAVGATVAAVLLLTARDRLHALAQRIELGEIVTAGKFLIVTGLVMPVLPNEPVTSLSSITPHQVWLAVLAVCTVSYASYLLQRYVAPKGASLWVAVLGGLYSSTATTTVLARKLADQPAVEPAGRRLGQSGILLATAIMYLRVLAIVFVFDRPLAVRLAPALAGLSLVGIVMALAWSRGFARPAEPSEGAAHPANPLELTAALVFAALFVATSLATNWARGAFGEAGIFALAAIIGVSDIDPFVLSLAQNATPNMAVSAAAAAVLIAASSNNLLKSVYTLAFAGREAGLAPALGLAALAAGGIAVAALLPAG